MSVRGAESSAEIILFEPDPVNAGVGKRKILNACTSCGIVLYHYSAFFMLKSILLSLLVVPVIGFAKEPSKDSLPTTFRTPSVTVSSTLAGEGKPATYSEFLQQEIRQKSTTLDLPSLLSTMPSIYSVSQNGNSIGYTSLSIRGFDQRRITVMINGVPQNDPEDHDVYWINFPDIFSNSQKIQVQRGAGLMNYGAAPMAGSVSILTNAGTQKPLIRYSQYIGFQNIADFSSGEESLQSTITKSSLELQSGLIDTTYSISARLSSIQSDGYRLHSWAHLQSYFISASRFDKNLTTQINIYGGPINDALAYTGTPKDWIYNPTLRRINMNGWAYDSTGKSIAWSGTRRAQEVEEFTQPHYELLQEWNILPTLTLKSILFYYTGDGYFDYDASWADAITLRISPQYGFNRDANPTNTIIRGSVSNKQGGWIPRLVWEHESGTLTAGTEIRSHRSYHSGKIQFAQGLPSDYDPDYTIYSYNGKRTIASAFAREEFRLNEHTSLLGELQFVHHNYGIENEKAGNIYATYYDANGNIISNGNQLFSLNYAFLNPRLGINHMIDDHHSVKASMAFTSREPRMRNFYAASDSYFGAAPLFEQVELNDTTMGFDFSKPLVKPEKMLNVELGWNYTHGLTHIAATGYAMEFFDELVKSGRLDIFGVPVDGNAPRTRHIGLELEAAHGFSMGNGCLLQATGNMTIGHNRIIDMSYYTSSGQAISLNNNRIAGFPDFMGFLQIGIVHQDYAISLNAKHIGSFRSDNFGDLLHSNNELKNDLLNSFNGYYADNVIDSYTVLGMNMEMQFRNIAGSKSNLECKAQIVNLLDTLFASGAEGKEFFPGQRRTIILGAELEL